MSQNPINAITSGSIAIKEMEFYAFHGVDPTEQKIGRNFQVDISFELDFEKAAIEDKLEETADYGVLYEIAKNDMAVTERLLETVVRRIAWRVKNKYPKAKNLKVLIRKMAPIVGGKTGHAEVGYQIA